MTGPTLRTFMAGPLRFRIAEMGFLRFIVPIASVLPGVF